MNTDLLNEEGYPLESVLSRIENWKCTCLNDIIEVLNLVKSIWKYNYWQEYKNENENHILYKISTGGWSGNEDLINAMWSNNILWNNIWYSSKRGGHYKFKVPLSFGETKT